MMKKYVFLGLLAFPLSNAVGQNFPIDFEETGFGAAPWNWAVFENANNPPLEIVENPDKLGANTSQTVAKFTALQQGQPFAGCETTHAVDLGSFTVTAAKPYLEIMVWKSVKSDVGLKLVRSDNWSLGEIKIANTKINEWEKLTFNFSGHIGNTYDQLVVFPDFNANRTSDNIVYFDNITNEITDSPTNSAEIAAQMQIFPNPAQAHFSVSTTEKIDEIKVFNLLGELVLQQNGLGNEQVNVAIAHLASGLYRIETTINGVLMYNKLIKN